MRINTNELRKQIKSVIDASVPSVYYGTKAEQTLPYAVFELEELQTIDGKTQQTLTINIFSKTSGEVESLADAVHEAFDHYRFMNSKIAFYTYRGNRIRVPEEDKNVQRIRLTVEVECYGREE